MKIITPGQVPEQITYRAVCSYCKCLFEFQRKEAKHTFDQREGDFLTIECPTCERPVTKGV